MIFCWAANPLDRRGGFNLFHTIALCFYGSFSLRGPYIITDCFERQCSLSFSFHLMLSNGEGRSGPRDNFFCGETLLSSFFPGVVVLTWPGSALWAPAYRSGRDFVPPTAGQNPGLSFMESEIRRRGRSISKTVTVTF